jgi:hypothetical protein
MRPDEAKWLFRWTRPTAAAAEINPLTLARNGFGSVVRIT